MPSPRASTACSGSPGRENGQGTVEFALITAGFLAAVIGLGALWRMFGEGKVVEHALVSASHHIQLAAAGAVADILLF